MPIVVAILCALLCASSVALPIIITHSETCSYEETDEQVLRDLVHVKAAFQKSRNNDRTNRELGIEPNIDDVISSELTSKVLATAFNKFRSGRLHSKDKKQRSLESYVPVNHTINGRKLSEEVVEDRRDRVLALLQVAYNFDALWRTTMSVGVSRIK